MQTLRCVLTGRASAGVPVGQLGFPFRPGRGEKILVEPQIGHLDSVVGLVWRSVVLWLLLLALLTLANLIG